MCLYVLFASRTPLRGVVAAVDQDQARILRDCVDRLVRGNAWLHGLIECQREKIVNVHTGSEMGVLCSDVA